MKLVALVAILFAALVSASVFSERNYVPRRWSRGGRADPSAIHPVRIFLKQRNTDRLTDVLLAVSDPDSPTYGKHWSTHEILDLVAPPKEDHDRVVAWLVEGGVLPARIQSFRDSLAFAAPVHVVEALFNTQLFVYKRFDRGLATINRQWGTSEIPSDVAELIDIVTGVDDFLPETRKHLRRPMAKEPSSPDDVGYVLPTVIQNVYKLPSKYGVSNRSSICLAEFQGDASFEKSDLSYFEQQTLSFPTAVETQHIVGPYNPNPPDAESTLDVQYATAVGMNTTMWFWTTTGWMLDFAQDFFNKEGGPLIVSMSWGWTSSAQCQIVNCNGESSQQYIERVNQEFKKIGAKGVSLFAASGDQGAPGDGDAYCDNYEDPISSIFPGASPYVTAVGATMLLPDATESAPARPVGATPPICTQYPCATSTKEGVCTYPTALITTGGGFSPYTPRPAWQEKAVSAYLKSGTTLPPSQYFNSSNRGFPDVAALGHNYPIRLGGQWEVVDGTSCSSPVFSAVFSLLNDVRLSKGKAPLGFAAPLLYKMWESDNSIFHDITTGNNKCTESCCDQYGYEAAAGWDATTGLGTPNFPKMRAYVEKM